MKKQVIIGHSFSSYQKAKIRCNMDLFEKIDLFEKLATSLTDDFDQEEDSNTETIEDYASSNIERRNSMRDRLRKLAGLSR